VSNFSNRLWNSIPLGLNNRKAQRKIVATLAGARADLNKEIRANVPSAEARKRKMERIDDRLEALAHLVFVDVEPLTSVTQEIRT
jgi:hypothetical protein